MQKKSVRRICRLWFAGGGRQRGFRLPKQAVNQGGQIAAQNLCQRQQTPAVMLEARGLAGLKNLRRPAGFNFGLSCGRL